MTTLPGPAEPYMEDRMDARLDLWIRNQFFELLEICLPDLGSFTVVGDDEDPSLDEYDVVLRAPDGTLYDVDIEVNVTTRRAS